MGNLGRSRSRTVFDLHARRVRLLALRRELDAMLEEVDERLIREQVVRRQHDKQPRLRVVSQGERE